MPIDNEFYENLNERLKASSPSGAVACHAITDTDRIDWLQTNRQTVWRVYHDEWQQTTETEFRRQKVEVFDGWVVNEMDEPNSDIRKAIDFAILSQNANNPPAL